MAERDVERDVELGHVDIDNTVKFLFDFDEKVRDRSKHHSRSIYMVPRVFRDLSPSSFTPRVVSIGPFHHEDEHLKEFEVQKETHIHNLFHKVLAPLGKPEQLIKACVTKVSGSIDQIKACYVAMPSYTNSELVKMMVRDACFILAFLYNFAAVRDPSLGENVVLYSHILIDMFLMENQIPFFVLQDIFECTFKKLDPTLRLARFIFIIKNYCHIFPNLQINTSNFSSTHDHILGFLHKSYQNPNRDSSRLPVMVKTHTVTELQRSGVRFSNELDPGWPMAMELESSRFLCFPLWRKLTVKMPTLVLTSCTESFIRNLVIYEHSSKVQTCITSYMKAIDMLIDTPEDVTRLVNSQVLVNRLGSDEKAANLINSMLEKVVMKDFYYSDEWWKLDEYYNSYLPNLIAESRRKYFSNPWSVFGLIGAIALFVFALIQTIHVN